MNRGDYIFDGMEDRCGWITGKSCYSGVAWKLFLRGDGGRCWEQWEMHCTPAPPPKSRPVLVCSEGVRV